jgi:hypothetical protein
VIAGRGFGLVSPESQCSDDLPAQHGIDDSAAEVPAIGRTVAANELRMKSARNRLTNDIVKERSRFLWNFNLIERQVSPVL